MANFQFHFSDIKMNFAQYVHFKGLKLSSALEIVFFHFTIFGFKNAKLNILKKIRVFSMFSAVFIALKNRLLQPHLADLEKKTLEFLLMTDFL